MTDRLDPGALRALFDPAGIVVIGASSHPGKFGFVALHNILAQGYEGRVFAVNRGGGTVLGLPVLGSVDELPHGSADLAFVCTSRDDNVGLLRACAARGIRAVYVTSAGYREVGPQGAALERELVETAAACGVLLAGPNGQGLVSTPAKLCAQIVAPNPPSGRIGIASQSGNFVSSFENFALATGVGVSRAISVGNAASLGVGDFLEYFAGDPATGVLLGYLENIDDGRLLAQGLERTAARRPLVLLKGGATDGGQRAASSHTGALATDDRIFDGMCEQFGVSRARSVEEAFEVAATFATQPLPHGPRVAVVTTAGGWGVITADAVTDSELELVTLPDGLRATIDTLLPPRWSRGNPIDLAGAETRDTIPEVLRLVAHHAGIDAVVYLGIGIQSNQARMLRTSSYFGNPDHDLARIAEFHERQDRRYAEAAAEVSASSGKPVLVATELAITDPANPGPASVRATGRLCLPSGERAVRALEHMWRYARWRERRGARE